MMIPFIWVLSVTNNFDTVGDPLDSINSLHGFLCKLLLVIAGHAAPQDDDASADFDVETAKRRGSAGARCPRRGIRQIAVSVRVRTIVATIRQAMDGRSMAINFANGFTTADRQRCVGHGADSPFRSKGMILRASHSGKSASAHSSLN